MKKGTLQVQLSRDLVDFDDQKKSISPESLAYTYAHAATSANTRVAYRSDVRHFIAWGGMLPTTPDEIIRYCVDYADVLNPNTLKRRLTAIKNWHQYQNLPDPTIHPLVRKTLSGIVRTHGRPQEKAPVLSVEQLIILTQHLMKKDRLIDWRDNAMLQIGFFGAFRRSELVSLHWEQINFVPKGVEVLLVRSKTDQEGEGHVCAIPYGNTTLCPVTTLSNWKEKSGRSSGPVFVPITKSGRLLSRSLHSKNVTSVLRKLATECQLPHAEHYSGHSLRRGFATSASQKGASLGAIMHHGRWRSAKTVIGYIEEGQRFEDNAAGLLLESSGNKEGQLTSDLEPPADAGSR